MHCYLPPVQVRGSCIVKGRAPPLVSGIDCSPAGNQGFKTLIVAAGGCIVEGGPRKEQKYDYLLNYFTSPNN